MKNIYFIIIALLILHSSCQNQNEAKLKFNSNWKFKLLDDADSESSLFKSDYNDSDWENVSLPHTAHLEPLVVNDQWQGTCWYRKTFEVPETKGKQIIIELEAAMNHSKIWVNGELLTVHQGGYLPIVIDVTKYVRKGKSNLIAVRLNNTDNAITGPKPLAKLDFNMYGGLYRNAWLITKKKVHISHPILADKVAGGGIFITTPEVSSDRSTVNIKTHINNESYHDKEVALEHVISFNGEKIQTQFTSSQSIGSKNSVEFVEQFCIEEPALWSPDEPNLYSVYTKVLIAGNVVDEETNRFGIRKFEFKENRLYINGVETYLRGVNRHQEYPFIGYALSDNAQFRDAKKIKDAGFNCIRLSHYPHSPAFMDACDELGLITIDAILGWQYYLDSDSFREYCYRSATELVRRDRNHPSVLSWEVSLNETKMPVFFMQKLHDIVHAEYPSALTYSCGWMNDVYDIYFQARQHRIMHHYDSIQAKPYFVSEYGDWEYHSKNPGLNQHKFNDIMRAEKSSRQLRGDGEKRMLQQATNWQEAYNDNLTTAAFGDGYWVMYDYNRGYHDNIESSGVMDIFRLPKFGFSFYQSQRDVSDTIVLDIASYWNEESPIDLKVYSNCDEVALYLNNELIAKQLPDADSITKNLNHPPFTFSLGEFKPGVLRAEGYLTEQKVAENIVQTPGKATALKIWVDESGKAPQANLNDVVFLYVAAVDANGTIVPNFEGELQIDTNANILVLNVGPIICEAGIATALVRVGDEPGEVSIDAMLNNLRADFSFEIKE